MLPSCTQLVFNTLLGILHSLQLTPPLHQGQDFTAVPAWPTCGMRHHVHSEPQPTAARARSTVLSQHPREHHALIRCCSCLLPCMAAQHLPQACMHQAQCFAAYTRAAPGERLNSQVAKPVSGTITSAMCSDGWRGASEIPAAWGHVQHVPAR